MSDTVNIKWVDGTLRSVDSDAIVKIRGGGVYEASYINDNYRNEYWDGERVLVEGDDPPVVNRGIDPFSITKWTLCEIEDSEGNISYAEVRYGNVRRGSGYSQIPLEKPNTILRTIHRPQPGMNMVVHLPDGETIEASAASVSVETSGGGSLSWDSQSLTYSLTAHLVRNAGGTVFTKTVD